MLHVFNYYDSTAKAGAADALAMLAICTHLPGSFWHGSLASFSKNSSPNEEEEEEEVEGRWVGVIKPRTPTSSVSHPLFVQW